MDKISGRYYILCYRIWIENKSSPKGALSAGLICIIKGKPCHSLAFLITGFSLFNLTGISQLQQITPCQPNFRNKGNFLAFIISPQAWKHSRIFRCRRSRDTFWIHAGFLCLSSLSASVTGRLSLHRKVKSLLSIPETHSQNLATPGVKNYPVIFQ